MFDIGSMQNNPMDATNNEIIFSYFWDFWIR